MFSLFLEKSCYYYIYSYFDKRYFLVLLLIGTSFFLHAQQHQIDSLQQELEHITLLHSKAKIYNALASIVIKQNPNLGIKYSHQALKAVPSSDLGLKGQIYNNLGIGHRSIQSSDSALFFLDSALYFNTQCHIAEQIALTNYTIAAVYSDLAFSHFYTQPDLTEKYSHKALEYTDDTMFEQKGNTYNLLVAALAQQAKYEIALQWSDSALFYFKKGKIPADIAMIYGTIGNLYQYTHQYKKAIDYLYQSLNILDSLGDIETKASVISSIGTLHLRMENFEEADRFIKKAIGLNEEIKDSIHLFQSYFNLGLVHLSTNKLEEALACFDTALPYLLAQQHWNTVALLYAKKAFALQKKGQSKEALLNLSKALKLKKYLVSEYSTLELQATRASLLYEIGQYEESIGVFEDMLDSAQLSSNIFHQSEALKGLEKNYVKTKRYQKAYELTKRNNILEDSIVQKENIDQIQELDIKYGTKKKEQENQLLLRDSNLQKLEAKRSRQFSYFVIGLLILLVIISILFIRQYRANMLYNTSQLKYKLLRNQMNPHFLFNTMSAIQSFIYQQKAIEASDYLASVATLMRAILDNSNEEYITIKKELEWLENYLSLQALRFENRFEYHIHMDEHIDINEMMIPPMLIQPFIENALEHGFKKENSKGILNIELKISNHQLKVFIKDNGIGFDPTVSEFTSEHQSHALRITKERVQLLNKKQKGTIFFDIDSVIDQGTTISFSIPLQD